MDWSPPVLWDNAGYAAALFHRGAPGFEARLLPAAWLVLSGEPVADANYGLVDAGPDAADRLRAFADELRARALPALVVLTDPVAADLAGIAADGGLQAVGRLPLMTLPLAGEGGPPLASPYRVEAVADAAALAAFKEVERRAFGYPAATADRLFVPSMLATPGLAYFLAWRGDEAVSAVATTQLGPVLGIWAMGTPPEFQRQGAGAALLAHVLAHHRRRGAELAYLLATEAGRPLYDRVGFRTAAEGAVWLAGESTQFPGH